MAEQAEVIWSQYDDHMRVSGESARPPLAAAEALRSQPLTASLTPAASAAWSSSAACVMAWLASSWHCHCLRVTSPSAGGDVLPVAVELERRQRRQVLAGAVVGQALAQLQPALLAFTRQFSQALAVGGVGAGEVLGRGSGGLPGGLLHDASF